MALGAWEWQNEQTRIKPTDRDTGYEEDEKEDENESANSLDIPKIWKAPPDKQQQYPGQFANNHVNGKNVGSVASVPVTGKLVGKHSSVLGYRIILGYKIVL